MTMARSSKWKKDGYSYVFKICQCRNIDRLWYARNQENIKARI